MRHPPNSGVPEAWGSSQPFSGPHGRVLIASEAWSMQSPEFLFSLYAHELGNILDIRLNPDSANRGYTYGFPNDPEDKDTGNAIDRCMFGSSPRPPG